VFAILHIVNDMKFVNNINNISLNKVIFFFIIYSKLYCLTLGMFIAFCLTAVCLFLLKLLSYFLRRNGKITIVLLYRFFNYFLFLCFSSLLNSYRDAINTRQSSILEFGDNKLTPAFFSLHRNKRSHFVFVG